MEENAIAGAALAPLMCLTSILPCGFMGIFMIFYLLMFVLLIVGLILWVIMLIDVVQRKEDEFPTPSNDQRTLWLLIVVIGGWIGALIYYITIYKKVGKAGSSK